MRVAAYIRVSTEDQDTRMQLDAIGDYAKTHNLNPDYFTDKLSGKSMRREEFQALLNRVRSKEYDTIIVYKLDRLTRSLRDLINLLDELTKSDCNIISIKDSLDFSTPAGRMHVHLLGVFAEFERGMISERVRSGMASAKRRGKKLGRKPKPVLTEEIRQQIKRGKSIEQIARQHNLSRSQIYRRLQVEQ